MQQRLFPVSHPQESKLRPEKVKSLLYFLSIPENEPSEKDINQVQHRSARLEMC
jgi:hypothetical protein